MHSNRTLDPCPDRAPAESQQRRLHRRRIRGSALLTALALVATLMGSAVAESVAATIRLYRDVDGARFTVCRDSDRSFVVTKPGGGRDAWGGGYTWDDIERAYRLSPGYQSYAASSC